MTHETLRALEEKIDRLIALCQRLKVENDQLRAREQALLKERGQLLERNELARGKVEAMIARLKSLDAEF